MSGLVKQLQAEALDSTRPISDLLRKAFIVSKKLGIKDFQKWIECELNGYAASDQIPEYRTVFGEIKIWNPYHGWIPCFVDNDDFASVLRTRRLSDSVGSLTSLLEQSEGFFTMSFPASVECKLMRMMHNDLRPVLHIGTHNIVAILEAIRNAILDWAIKLEEEGILGEGLSFTEKEKEKASSSPSIHIESFQGILGNVANSTVAQNLNMTVQKGDFNSLSDFLSKHGVSVEDIGELKKALSDDPKPQSKTFGEKVGAWIGKMIGNAASGIWKISVDVATNLLANAIWAYYGLQQ